MNRSNYPPGVTGNEDYFMGDPEDDPRPGKPFTEVKMTSPGIWCVGILYCYTNWGKEVDSYLPAGEIVENYRPFEEWAKTLVPIRDGFRAKTLNQQWSEARVFKTFKEAQDWIINNNPFGITPF